jgi:hypothetical protein
LTPEQTPFGHKLGYAYPVRNGETSEAGEPRCGFSDSKKNRQFNAKASV